MHGNLARPGKFKSVSRRRAGRWGHGSLPKVRYLTIFTIARQGGFRAPKLDFIDAGDFPFARMSWHDDANIKKGVEGDAAGAASAANSLLRRTGISWLSAAAAFVMVLYAASFSFYPVAAQAGHD